METKHRDIIQSNFSSLVERTDLNTMVSALFERGVFSQRMIEPYMDATRDERSRKRHLYMDVTRRGPDAFRHLVNSLREQGHWELARDLDPDSLPRMHSAHSYTGSRSSEFLSLKEKRKTKEEVSSKVNESVSQLPQEVKPPTVSTEPSNQVKKDTTEVKPLHVIKSTKFIKDKDCGTYLFPLKKHTKMYPTRGRKRGALIGFYYTEFDNNAAERRHGAEVDSMQLKYLFSEMGFTVRSFQNIGKQETLDALHNLRESLVGYECVFVVVSSHGHEMLDSTDNHFRCNDGGLISYRQVIEVFNNKNCPQLRNVPKIFILQMCRGEDQEHMHSEKNTDGIARNSPLAGPPLRSRHPDRIYSDILIAHSTLPGHVSRRDPQYGSWYIQVLCEVFAERAHDTDVEELFSLVDERLAHKFQIQTSSVEKWGFNKRLYLHPGLFEE